MRRFGSYQIESIIGEGQSSLVYLARLDAAGQPAPQTAETRVSAGGSNTPLVALKVIPLSIILEPTLFARLTRLVDLVQLGAPPGLVRVHQIGEIDAHLALAMDYLPGGSLAQRLERAPLMLPEIAALLTRVAAVLDHLHALGSLHLDLKPSNILFDAAGQAYLSDTGMGLLAQAAAWDPDHALTSPPAYLAPEVGAPDQTPDGRADQYSLGVLLFELLTGRLPFQTPSPLGLAVRHLLEPAPAPSQFRPDLPAGLDQVLAVALAKDPAERYASCAEFAAAFVACLAQPVTAQPTRIFARQPESAPIVPPRMQTLRLPEPVLSERRAVVNPPLAARRASTPLGWGCAFAGVVVLLLAAAAYALGWLPGVPPNPALVAWLAGATGPTPQVVASAANPIVAADITAPVARLTLTLAPPPAGATPAASPTPRPTATRRPTSTPTSGGFSVPPGAPTPAPNYVIAYNDTLFKIAASYGVDLGSLMALNNHQCDSYLYPGKELLIPAYDLAYHAPEFQPLLLQNAGQQPWLGMLDCLTNIVDLHFSPDGSALAVASGTQVYLYRWGDWIPLRSFDHRASLTAFAFSPDGLLLATAGSDQVIKLWNVADASKVRELRGHASTIHDLNFSPDGAWLASASQDQTARVWSLADGKAVHTLRGFAARSAVFSPDGSLLAVGYIDFVSLYTLDPAAELARLPAAAPASHLVFSPDGSLLASSVNLWQVQQQITLYTFPETGHGVFFNRDGRLLQIGGRVYRVSNGAKIHEMESPIPPSPRRAFDYDSLALSPDGGLLAWGTKDGVFLYGLAGSSGITAALPSGIVQIAAGDNYLNLAARQRVKLNALLLSNGLTCTHLPFIGQEVQVPANQVSALPASVPALTLDNLNQLEARYEMDLTCAAELDFPFLSPAGDLLISGKGVWHVANQSLLIKDGPLDLDRPVGQKEPAPFAVLSPDGMLVAVRSGAEINLWEAATGRLLNTLRGHTGRIQSLAFSPDGRWLASGSDVDQSLVYIWDMTSLTLAQTLPGYAAEKLTWLPDSATLLTEQEGTLRVWQVAGAVRLATISGIAGFVNLSPDGQYLAFAYCEAFSGSACRNELVDLYRTSDWSKILTMIPQNPEVTSLAFTADSRQLLAASGYTIMVWEVSTGQVLQRLRARADNQELIADIFFSPDGRMLLSRSTQGVLRFWNASTWEIIYTLDESVQAAAFNASQTYLVTQTSELHLYGIRP